MYCHETTVKPTITYESITDFDYTDLYVDSVEELRNQHNMLLINDEIKLNSEYWTISDEEYMDLNVKEVYNNHHCKDSVYNKIFFYEFTSDKNSILSGIDLVSNINSLHFVVRNERFIVYNSSQEMLLPAVIDIQMSLENFLSITASDESIQNYLMLC